MYYARHQSRKVLQEARHMSNNGRHTTEYTSEPLTIRDAGAADLSALSEVAQRDSARMIDCPAVVALTGGEVRAAISLSDGAVIADPFHRTVEIVELLRAHVRAMARTARRSPVHYRSAEQNAGHRRAVARLRRAV
jgi:hypothetical protein